MPNPRWSIPVWELTPTPDAQGVLLYGPTDDVHHHTLDGVRVRSFGGHDPSSHRSRVAKAVFHPDGKRLLTAGSCVVKVWDWASGACLDTLEEPGAYWTRGLVLLEEGKYAVSVHGESGRGLKLLTWNLEKRKLATKTGLTHTIDSMERSDDADVFVTLPDGAWRIERGRPRTVAGFHYDPAPLTAIALSPDASLTATADADGIIRVFRTVPHKPALRTLKGHRGGIHNLRFVDNDRLVSAGSTDGTLRIWKVATGRALRVVKDLPKTSLPGCLALSPDGALALVAGYDAALVDLATGQTLATWLDVRATNAAFVGPQPCISVAVGEDEVRVLRLLR